MRIFLVSCFMFFASALFAQPAQKPPHESGAVETGVISGTLLEGGKKPVAGQIVTLEILSGHQLILSLPKETDAKGAYQFKNIFMSPDFSYAVSAEFEGKTYRTNFVTLGKSEKLKKLDLLVGAGAKEGPQLPPPIDEQMMGTMDGGEEHVHQKGFTEYQLLAIVLAVAAIFYAIWQRRRR